MSFQLLKTSREKSKLHNDERPLENIQVGAGVVDASEFMVALIWKFLELILNF
jgi:hypothetical protein